MSKFFNTAGLCFPEDHYMVNPLQRLTEVEELIAKKLYFTLHIILRMSLEQSHSLA